MDDLGWNEEVTKEKNIVDLRKKDLRKKDLRKKEIDEIDEKKKEMDEETITFYTTKEKARTIMEKQR